MLNPVLLNRRIRRSPVCVVARSAGPVPLGHRVAGGDDGIHPGRATLRKSDTEELRLRLDIFPQIGECL